MQQGGDEVEESVCSKEVCTRIHMQVCQHTHDLTTESMCLCVRACWYLCACVCLCVPVRVCLCVLACDCVLMCVRVCVCSLFAWGELTAEEARKRSVMSRIVHMMQNKCLAVATHQWCHHVDELKAEQAEQARKEHVMQTVVKRMMNGIMACAFGRWRESVCDNKMMLAKSNKVVMRWKNQAAARRCIYVFVYVCVFVCVYVWLWGCIYFCIYFGKCVYFLLCLCVGIHLNMNIHL